MSREAMQMALEALEGWANYGKWVWPESALEQAKRNTTDSIAALRQALETEQEPVAWYDSETGITDFHSFKPVRKPSSPTAEWIPLYTTPQPQEFVCSTGFCRFTLTQTGVGINVPDEEKRKK